MGNEVHARLQFLKGFDMPLSGLKVAINTLKIDKPFGGGNLFSNYMEKYLISKECKVYRKLVPGLDLILLIQAEPQLSSIAFTPSQIATYLRFNPATAVIHRINTNDEQRGKDLGVNRAVLNANRVADYSVFVSHFVENLFKKNGFDQQKPHCVIHTGADEEIFNPVNRAEPDPDEPLRIVTHHWSDNYLKGFDIYERLDLLISGTEYSKTLEFTLIGNRPLGSEFHNSRLIPPLCGVELAAELKRHHFYLTGARHEPAGNHYIEAISCGLPVLFLSSGSSGEYCSEYGGISYDLTNFEAKLKLMVDSLGKCRTQVLKYNYSARSMADAYWELIQQLVKDAKSQTGKAGSPMLLAGLKIKKIWNRLVDKTCYELNRLKVKDDL